MTSSWSGVREDAPIDAEFETNAAGQARSRSRARLAAAPRRSRSITLVELVFGSVVAAIAGAAIAVAVVGSGSGVSIGPMAIELSALKQASAELAARHDQDAATFTGLRVRVDAAADRIAAREAADLDLRNELAALNAQISALGGGVDPAARAGANVAMSPIGVLLRRIEKLEEQVVADSAQPQTGPELQRTLRELSDRITALDAANGALTAALTQQSQAMQRLEGDLASAQFAKPGRSAIVGRSLAEATAPAAQESRLREALARLEDAANRGISFASQQGQLASLAPLDPDIAALAPIARAGAPTAEQLRRAFEAIAAPRMARISERLHDNGTNWLRTAMTGVALERGDELAPLAEARSSLAGGDFAAAVNVRLPPEFAAWREAVLRRRQLDVLLERLHAR